VVEVCEEEQVELLLIAGDLFHRQPLLRELKDVSYLLGKLTHTQVVLSAGNHDYIKAGSYYLTYKWPENVHLLSGEELETIEFPELQTAVSGFSYHSREIKECTCQEKKAQHRQKYEILLLHGGDDNHVPFQKEKLLKCEYDYIALGHIHKPQPLVKDKIVYCGALEPIDKNDVGVHGYVIGEMTERGCKTRFVPSAVRQYRHDEIEVTPDMTGFALREKIGEMILENGKEHLYKIILTGFRDPEVQFDLSERFGFGNVVEIVDETAPAYDFERLMEQNAHNILGYLIRELKDYDRDSVEYGAMCEGVKALVETRRD
jgi:hypothetical protein